MVGYWHYTYPLTPYMSSYSSRDNSGMKYKGKKQSKVNNLDVYGMDNLSVVIAFLNGSRNYDPMVVDTRKEFYEQQYTYEFDFSDVKGQQAVKRALEVAASGSHNVSHRIITDFTGS